MTIYTSCGANEVALDAGEGIGGLWTTQTMAKGIQPQHGKQMTL